MPNPFPGMDPYLEGDLWMTVHTDLCAEIARQLSPKLRPKYVALSTRRVVLAAPDESELFGLQRFPDVGVVSSHESNDAAISTIAAAPLVLPVEMPEPIPHVSIEIRDVAGRRLVACIEVLSPSNKKGTGREEYAGKRFHILSGQSHLIEIDLLRTGIRFPTREPLPPTPYFVFLSRAARRKDVEVWPIALNQSLPEITVPLLPGDADVKLDLQQALSTVYRAIGIDPSLTFPNGSARPMYILDDRERVRELI